MNTINKICRRLRTILSVGLITSVPVVHASDGLVSWYRAEGNAADSADSNNGTLQNGATFATGKVGQGFSFNGANSYVEVPDNTNLDLSTFTLAAWIQVPQTLWDYQTIVSKSYNSGSTEQRNYGMFVNAFGREFTAGSVHISFINPPELIYSVQASTRVTDGIFHHVAATFDPAVGLRIFVDGVDETTPAPYPNGAGVIPSVNDVPLSIGLNSPTANPYGAMNGIVDEIRIYNRALSDSEIIYLACSSCNQPPIAIAGPNQNVRAGDTVFLDGRASYDDNTASADLAYSWSFSSRPSGSTATLNGATTATPSFVADMAGTYDIQLVVTDGDGLSSTPAHVICSSANLAPTAVATVDYNLVIVGETVHLNGAASTDPESDPLSYSWSITSQPLGSTATLVGPNTAFPTLTPDKEGVYQLTLVVSDFIGPGTPATVEVTATTAAGFAEFKILNASSVISSLNSSQITTQGNQTALLNFLSQAVVAIQNGRTAAAIDKLQKALERTDGCFLRNSPDGNGAGMDWITDCSIQNQVYSLLNDALDALTQ